MQPLGQGGFGKTFLAVDEQLPLKPRCVIKQLSFPTEDREGYRTATRLFRQEALRLQELGHHPQIPQLLAHFEQQDQLYLVQEFIEGRTLGQELQTGGAFQEEQIRELLQELLSVLHFIHQRQIVHRDIKPGNIIHRSSLISSGLEGGEMDTRLSSETEVTVSSPMLPTPRDRKRAVTPPLSYEGEICDRPALATEEKGGKFVLIDFGVAKLLTGTAHLPTGTIVGSVEYMAPEQTRGKAIPASDLYSLGVTCIRLLTDVSPWDMYDMANDRWAWRYFLPSGKSVSDRLGKVLDKLLQNSVSQRYQSAEEVLQVFNPPLVATAPAVKTLKPELPKRNFLTRILPQLGQPSDDDLTSAAGVDYTKLQHLLASHNWKEADRETWAVLCQALGKAIKSYFAPQVLDNLPCQDLQAIDQLWVKYSSGKFGFSIQKQIFESVGGDYGKFCALVGWLTYNSHNRYEGLKFNLRAPTGHLPSRIWVAGLKWWQHAEVMALKLEKCGQG